jgi:hypothetical protein
MQPALHCADKCRVLSVKSGGLYAYDSLSRATAMPNTPYRDKLATLLQRIGRQIKKQWITGKRE